MNLQSGEVTGVAYAARDGEVAATLPSRRTLLSTAIADRRQRRVAGAVAIASAVVFLAALPFARQPLTPVWAFIPAYQSALALNDLITAVLLFGQFAILRSRGLLLLASGYLFAAFMAALHALSFPGLFAPGGLLGAGPQTTAWLYMFWHAGFPLLVIAYALDGTQLESGRRPAGALIAWSVAAAAGAAGALTVLAAAGQDALPPIMRGNHYTDAMIAVVSAVWLLSFAALGALWRRRPHSVLDLWLAVVMCAWLFDVGLSAVFNAGRFDLGFYAGRLYGLAAASFVLIVLLLDHGVLFARLARSHELESGRLEFARRNLSRHRERLRILHEIDRAIVAQQSPEAIAAAVIRPLRELLGVPRAIVNKFDLEAGEVEWIAAAGRRRMHVGPGVRYSIRLMGEIEALRRGEPQRIDVHALPQGPERESLLASDVHVYMVVPMIAGGELIGALSFGAGANDFPPEQLNIAQEVATQLAIAISQARLHERVRRHAEDLEQRVAERTAELEDLYNNAPCGYHSVDRHGKFVRMNDTELRWLGYTREEVVGRMGPADLHTPGSLKLFRERFEPFKQTGAAQDVEYDFRRKDGTVLSVVLNATAVRDANGEFVMSRSTIFDNTERKRVEQAVRDSEREVRMLHAATLEISKAEGSTEALAVLLRKVCEYSGWVYAQSWLPYGERLELGHACHSAVPALESFRKANERLGTAPPGGALEGVWRNKEPAWIWELQPALKAVRRALMLEAGLRSWIGFPVLADGEVIAVIEFFDLELRSRDERVLRLISILANQIGPVIRRKRAEEQVDALNVSLKRYTAQLETSNKDLESFSYSVSHDLRAPLRAIDGFARMLGEDYGERLDAEGRRLLDVVRSSSRHMGQLIDDLLDFSRLGRKELNKQGVDMAALALEAARELGAAPEIGVLASARADRTLLRQVWLNLIGNAVKYTGKRADPRIEIGGREEAAENVYWVRDNGVGFDMRYAQKLFGVFQRLHGQDEFPGTGVGLAIVQRVVARHGGRVWAESRPGEGACFYFSLPGAA